MSQNQEASERNACEQRASSNEELVTAAVAGADGVTFTQRCRLRLTEQPGQAEFQLSRGGLETLVLDSERYGVRNEQATALLLAARQIASDTTMFQRDSDEWLSGGRDDQLPRVLRAIADGRLMTFGSKASSS